MKHIYAAIALAVVLPISAEAQLINGSFEDNGAFSLTGWEWTCADPQPEMDAPVGGGIWSAWKEPGHAKGCFPSYLFQRIDNVPYGVVVQVSGWVKCPSDGFQTCLGGSIGFGILSSGSVLPAGNTVSTEPEWTFITASHVFDPGPEDTAVVLLNSGFIGGPINPLPAGFDQITWGIALSMDEIAAPIISLLPDPANGSLHVGSNTRILSVDIIDPTGRIVLTAPGRGSTSHVRIGSLAPGTYTVLVFTDHGELAERFYKG